MMRQASGAIVVYTCATNGRDMLREDQCTEGAQFIAFVEAPCATGSLWEQHAAKKKFFSPRRDARMHKVLSHQFIEADYSIWLDANVALQVPAQQLIDTYLQHADLAVFQHRTRACTFDEAARCQQLALDSAAVIEEQMAQYARRGLQTGLGLPETTVVIRRHSAQVRRFNEAWWSEICRHSVRDQISFMYAAQQSGLAAHFMLPTKYLNPFFSMSNRPAGAELAPAPPG